ncbi:MAG: hypothetical protein U9Q03_03630 [Patescibacteria group bacterium]|nr:hypothetical protein [Patescibacteria group bacterium]
MPLNDSDPNEMLWLLVEDDMSSLAGVHLLDDGDFLTVFDEDDEVVFNGLIEYDFLGECVRSLGLRVKWIQRDWDPDDWGRLFMTGQERPYRAELRKRTIH